MLTVLDMVKHLKMVCDQRLMADADVPLLLYDVKYHCKPRGAAPKQEFLEMMLHHAGLALESRMEKRRVWVMTASEELLRERATKELYWIDVIRGRAISDLGVRQIAGHLERKFHVLIDVDADVDGKFSVSLGNGRGFDAARESLAEYGLYFKRTEKETEILLLKTATRLVERD